MGAPPMPFSSIEGLVGLRRELQITIMKRRQLLSHACASVDCQLMFVNFVAVLCCDSDAGGDHCLLLMLCNLSRPV